MLNGREDEVRRRLRRGRLGGRNCVRVFTRCRNLFSLDGSMAGFWDAVERAWRICAEEGYYFSPVLLVDLCREKAPGQFERVLPKDETKAWVSAWLDRYRGNPLFFWSLVNEPEQPWQGFSGPLDPELLEYARMMRDALGHKDFIIGAVPDGDNVDASAETLRDSIEVAKWCNGLALHSSRMGHANPSGERWRRWIDHLEGFVDIVKEARKVNPDVFGYHEESMGHADVKDVPLPNGRTYPREFDPEAALAAAVTSETAGLIYCFHYISLQNDGVEAHLRLLGMVLAHYPAGWVYMNDSWSGAPTRGFGHPDNKNQKIEGKVRHYVRPDGREARTLAYSLVGVPSFDWVNGFGSAREIYRGSRVGVWATTHP